VGIYTKILIFDQRLALSLKAAIIWNLL